MDHAAYISSWLDVLRRDNRAVLTAASKAQEAVEYLRDLVASTL
jgi:antirestriction protein ArdC